MPSSTPDFLSALRYSGPQMATLRAPREYQGKPQTYTAQSSTSLAALWHSDGGARMSQILILLLRYQLDHEAGRYVRPALQAMKTEGLVASAGKGWGVKWVQPNATP